MFQPTPGTRRDPADVLTRRYAWRWEKIERDIARATKNIKIHCPVCNLPQAEGRAWHAERVRLESRQPQYYQETTE